MVCAGCVHAQAQDPDAIVMRVGPVEHTLREFSAHFHRVAGMEKAITLDRAGIEQVLEDRVTELLAHVSVMGDSGIVTRMDLYYTGLGVDQIYQRALTEHLLPKYLDTSDEVLGEVYGRLATQLHLEAIKVPTDAEMEEVQAALDSGEAFDAVARRLSRDPSSSHRGGNLGWIDADRFPVAQQEILWSLDIGEISAPIAERQFHAVYRLVDRRPGPALGSLEEERSRILRGIHQAELGRAGKQMHEDLMTAYNYRVDMDAAEWMREFLHRETAGARRTYDPEKDKPYAELGKPTDPPYWDRVPLEGADAERPVAFIDGDTLTALEVIDELDFKPQLGWPTFENILDVTDLCSSALYYRVQILEAKRLGLDRDPEVVRQVTDRTRMMFWRAYRRERLLPSITPTEEELRDLYEARIEEYRLPERRRFVLVNTVTPELAEQAADLFQEGLVPSSIVRELGGPDADFQITPDTTSGWVTRGQHPPIDPDLFRLSEGEVSEPIPDRGRYSVLRVERISPAHLVDFETASEELSKQIMRQREQERIAEMAEEARKTTDVWVDRETILGIAINEETVEQQRAGSKPF